MRVKIYYRSPVIWNLVLFIFFSLVFLVLQEIYVNITTILNRGLLLKFFEERIWYLVLCGLSMLSLIRLGRFSKFLLIGVVLSTFVLTSINLNAEFSKMILVILFFYLLIGYYLYQFFKMDLMEPFYNPGYSNQALFEPMLSKIMCSLQDKKSGQIATGYLTNWSAEGCYVHLNEAKALGHSVEITVHYENMDFIQPATVASKNKNLAGYGLKFLPSPKTEKSDIMEWWDFYEIIDQKGFTPELLT